MPIDGMSPEDIQSVIHSLQLMRQSSYIPIASGALLGYDYILTVYDERNLVWKAKWSVGKVLFLLTRYPTFVDVGMAIYHNIAPSIPSETCVLLYNVSGWMVIIGMIIAEIIMVIRVWALWGNSKIVGAILVVLSIIGVVVTAISYALFSGSLEFIATDTIAPGLIGCLPGRGTNIVFIGYLVLMAYEVLVMILLLLKGVQHFRHVSTNFLYAFYQDGIVYYGVLLLISVLNVIVLLTGPRENANLLTTYVPPSPIILSSPNGAHTRPRRLQRTFHSILSARMLLQLRKSARKRQFFTETFMFVDGGVSTMMFVDGPGQATTTARRRNTVIATWFGDDGRDRPQ
ncbi:hypothetical protein BDN71DRAFT_1502307 [Pleurotus eryngii]|uniref:DUF6533 domain-containing protein n=1 Tax=Pleurotus eryngii TaxID=5323 RepID=A0A9P6A9J0_PLEER|nr:hypothetical protein BDN71DRAFT_1502307 [Pleurotus eryngii]